MTQPIYLDHAAGTPLLPAAWDAMQPWTQLPGNPASSHRFGQAVRVALEDARRRVALRLDADPADVLFTSGATEANNLALFGLIGDVPGTLITSSLEHPCVVEPMQRLGERGHRSLHLPVASSGVVLPPAEPWPADLRLATLQLVNHETGAIQPVPWLRQQIGERIPLHCDAAAAVGKIPVSFRGLGASSLTLSAHKFHGPSGIGVLLIRPGTKLKPLLLGGHQQNGKRPGTEPVALAVGLATALDWVCDNLDAHFSHVLHLREQFLTALQRDAGPVVVNSPEVGVPHILNIAFPGVSADALLMALDLAGVGCSTGSACSSGSLLPSPVLKAMRVAEDVLRSSMRFSFSPTTTAQEVAESSSRITSCVKRLRRISEAGDE